MLRLIFRGKRRILIDKNKLISVRENIWFDLKTQVVYVRLKSFNSISQTGAYTYKRMRERRRQMSISTARQ